MRRQASAATAEPTKGRGGSFGDFLRGALATRASSSRVDGSGVSAAAGRFLGLLIVPLIGIAVLIGSVATADAATQRPFKETFGAVEQPILEKATAVAVDPGTGDVLVGDASKQGILRFHSDGTPAPFSALGTNFIDGREANGKPCAEEPESCDQTPQNGIEMASSQIAVDNSGGATDGNIYITQIGTGVIDIFASDGEYLGQLDATGTIKFESNRLGGVAVDASGVVYVALNREGGEIAKFVPASNPPVNEDYVSSIHLPPAEFPGALALGSGSSAGSIFAIADNGQAESFVLKINKATGEREYRFSETHGLQELLSGIAVDPASGHVLTWRFDGPSAFEGLVEYDASGDSAVQVGRVLGGPGHAVTGAFAFSDSGDDLYVAGGSEKPLAVFGAPSNVPTVTADAAGEITGSKALLTGRVDPEGLELTDCYYEYGEFTVSENSAACEGPLPTGSDPKTVRAEISGLVPGGHMYKFRLVAETASVRGESPIQSFVTASTVATEAPNPVGTTTATLRGTVRPEGTEYSACFFEYGLASSDSPEKTAPCAPGPAVIPPDFAPHQVSAAIGGLQVGKSYRFRLVATNADGTLEGEELTFTTLGKPRISEIRARDSDQKSVTLEAKINPSGFGTSYHFEWGETKSYGNDIPVNFEPFVGSGTEPVRISATISGLSAGSVYHYKIVASNSIGTAESPDRIFETLNSCGLPKQRCFELVSPREAGPVANPGRAPAGSELRFQAAPEPGSMAYIVEAGFPDATRGAEVLYRGTRGSSGWSSAQLSPPILAPNEANSPNSNSSQIMALSPDLSCGVVGSNQPLTSDASTRPVVEAGGSNLYRRNPDGSYDAITKLTPTNFEDVEKFFVTEYRLDGMSPDCSRIVFETKHVYPGVPSVPQAGGYRLYEWQEGELRNLGSVPGPSGEVAVPAVGGTEANHSNVISRDGGRVFFSARRQISPNPSEIGNIGVFVRENGVTRDLSLSETSTPAGNVTYQYAAKDGSRVFFTAAAGMTEESSAEGIDLYEYNLETEDLRDLTVEDDLGGAEVSGFIGASEDGSHIYFAAKGQLVPGKGKTYAQNQSSNASSVYGASEGRVEYVGSVTDAELHNTESAVSVVVQANTTSRVSHDGDYLLFETSANVTGYESIGSSQVYLYSAADEATICVSCRPDGQPSLNESRRPLLVKPETAVNPLYQPPSLVVSHGLPSVFFYSRDRLATGSVEGLYSLYEWSHDQVFTIDSEGPGRQPPSTSDGSLIGFFGASAEGMDLYFATTNTLTWEDGDERYSLYDARIGGGNPEPPSPPVSCDPTREGSCQRSSAQPAPSPSAASLTFKGSGNAKQKGSQKRHKKHHKKRKHQKGKHKQKNHGNGNRRAGK